MKDRIKKILLESGFFMCGCITSALIFSMFFKTDAAGTCPITLQPIQSTGNLIFSPFQFHSSDLVNLRSEINDLGAWADGEISALNIEVTNGKNSLRDKINSKKSGTLHTGTIPTFAQLVSAIDTIYTEAKDEGVEYQKTHSSIDVVETKLDISWNDSISGSWTATEPGKVIVQWRMHDVVGGDDAYCRFNGTDIGKGPWNSIYTVSTGDRITYYQANAMTEDPPNDGYLMIIYYH